MTFQASVKAISEQINHDRKNLSNWLNANKIALNVNKNELGMFSPPKKQLDHELKLKLNDKKLHQTDSVKYLEIHLGKYFTSEHQIKNAAIKLNKANAVLTKIRHCVDMKTLKSIYHAIFELQLCYASLFWTYNSSSDRRLYILQKQSLRLMLFQNRNTHACPLFKNSKVLKFSDKIALENFILVNLLANFYQKSFVTGSLYLLNFTHIIPNGQTMVE